MLIGGHVNARGGIDKAVDNALAVGAEVLAATGVAILIAGCGSGSTSSATSSTAPASSSQASSSGSSSTGAPPSSSGGATAAVQLIPGTLLCNVLTADQIKSGAGFDIAAAAANDTQAITECDFKTADGNTAVSIKDDTQAFAAAGDTPDRVATALLGSVGADGKKVTIASADIALINTGPVGGTPGPGVALYEKGHWIAVGIEQSPPGDLAAAITNLGTVAATFISTQQG